MACLFIVDEVRDHLMGRDQHDDRKRAFALGKFKFLYQVYIHVQLSD